MQASTEDQDMEKAIADSLMTASFHSASALQAVERPTPRERDAETYVVSSSGPLVPFADKSVDRWCFGRNRATPHMLHCYYKL